ncbi:uncharacterized protein LOC128872056 isoform X1 [Hylaeus volcanicus]|uniref:uncharacterized protein LOC128872056 isoform X1 n=1 Tax=Hylaeus volcanicus TaxID=313075 RepID=UPI0023B7E485|nr:uncharacterized protein LOC128872056 isoform X1 [Hylaeus volcanicus]XP_053970337.1 uncharacterized protein LOC128872056 isoform X1 [Hylaeus volcanicus]XP_053970338.1 uncharacterized protein LOC128872056 isoform X1 [Hylaeus volcanicus]
MEDIKSVKHLISMGCFMCFVDLKDAYYLVPIHKSFKKFLRFKFQGQMFQFTCLPFGLCTSPFVYTKIMKPVINKIRESRILSVIHIYDLLLISKSYESCRNNLNYVTDLLERLGFIINYQKSSLEPSQRCKYLGFIINSTDFTLELTNNKKKQITSLVKTFKQDRYFKIRDFTKLLGTLTAACPAVVYGSIYCKRLERQKYLALILNDNDYEGKIHMNKSMIDELRWWERIVPTGSNPIRTQKFELEISSDASLTGWGTHCNGKSAEGFWTKEERKHCINYLELLAAYFGLKCFAGKMVESEILLRIDNTSAISYINRTGGIQYPHLNELTRKLWQWCERRKIWIHASYIPSAQNKKADRASRITNIDTEWELCSSAFENINTEFGPFTIDLFASRLNKKCSRFCSGFPDPEAMSVDAFTISWTNEKIYAFPPFALALRTLRKIILDKAEGTVVLPLWPTQPWYPLFISLLTSPPIIFKSNKDLLISPSRKETHPLALKLSLVAGNLSGKLSDVGE